MAKAQLKERPAQASLLPDPEPAPAPKPPATRSKTAKTESRAVAIAKPQRTPGSLLELCLMAARDKSIPTDRVRAFLEMAREEETREAEILFDEAMLAAQTEMPPIPRDAYNTHTKSWWSRIEQVAAKMDPIIRKHAFTLKHGVGEQRIEDHYHLFADVTWSGKLSSGKKASFTKRFDADIGRDDKGPKGEGTKSLAQGSGSSINYGRRYLKLMIFDGLVLGMDRDGAPAGAELCSVDEIKDVKKRRKAAIID